MLQSNQIIGGFQLKNNLKVKYSIYIFLFIYFKRMQIKQSKIQRKSLRYIKNPKYIESVISTAFSVSQQPILPREKLKQSLLKIYNQSNHSKCSKHNSSYYEKSWIQQPSQFTHNESKQVNWIKFNILIGIYKNWIRLAPFILHLLQKSQNKEEQRKTKKAILKLKSTYYNLKSFYSKSFQDKNNLENSKIEPFGGWNTNLQAEKINSEFKNKKLNKNMLFLLKNMFKNQSNDQDLSKYFQDIQVMNKLFTPTLAGLFNSQLIRKQNKFLSDFLQKYASQNTKSFNENILQKSAFSQKKQKLKRSFNQKIQIKSNLPKIVSLIKERFRNISELQSIYLDKKNIKKKFNQLLQKPIQDIKKLGIKKKYNYKLRQVQENTSSEQQQQKLILKKLEQKCKIQQQISSQKNKNRSSDIAIEKQIKKDSILSRSSNFLKPKKNNAQRLSKRSGFEFMNDFQKNLNNDIINSKNSQNSINNKHHSNASISFEKGYKNATDKQNEMPSPQIKIHRSKDNKQKIRFMRKPFHPHLIKKMFQQLRQDEKSQIIPRKSNRISIKARISGFLSPTNSSVSKFKWDKNQIKQSNSGYTYNSRGSILQKILSKQQKSKTSQDSSRSSSQQQQEQQQLKKKKKTFTKTFYSKNKIIKSTNKAKRQKKTFKIKKYQQSEQDEKQQENDENSIFKNTLSSIVNDQFKITYNIQDIQDQKKKFLRQKWRKRTNKMKTYVQNIDDYKIDLNQLNQLSTLKEKQMIILRMFEKMLINGVIEDDKLKQKVQQAIQRLLKQPDYQLKRIYKKTIRQKDISKSNYEQNSIDFPSLFGNLKQLRKNITEDNAVSFKLYQYSNLLNLKLNGNKKACHLNHDLEIDSYTSVRQNNIFSRQRFKRQTTAINLMKNFLKYNMSDNSNLCQKGIDQILNEAKQYQQLFY